MALEKSFSHININHNIKAWSKKKKKKFQPGVNSVWKLKKRNISHRQKKEQTIIGIHRLLYKAHFFYIVCQWVELLASGI